MKELIITLIILFSTTAFTEYEIKQLIHEYLDEMDAKPDYEGKRQDQTFFIATKCAAGMYVAFGGDNPNKDDELGDQFLVVSKGMGYIIDAEQKGGKKTKGQVDTEVEDLIQSYFDEYVNHQGYWYANVRTDPDEVYSPRMKEDLQFCLEIGEQMGMIDPPS